MTEFEKEMEPYLEFVNESLNSRMAHVEEIDRMMCAALIAKYAKYKDDRIKELEQNNERLFDWLMDENREKAVTKFTSGELRNLAREIEFRIRY